MRNWRIPAGIAIFKKWLVSSALLGSSHLRVVHWTPLRDTTGECLGIIRTAEGGGHGLPIPHEDPERSQGNAEPME